jgi:N-acyl-L-homoserine lactone synthetase
MFDAAHFVRDRHEGKSSMIDVYRRSDLRTVPLLSRTMHEDRKRVFLDALGWDVPHDGAQEADQFDDDQAVYLVEQDCQGTHRASVRLLSTERAHILGSIFPDLCAGEVPRGPTIKEITRYIASPRAKASERLVARNQMARALIEYGLRHGISTYTAVCDLSFLNQVLAAGWRCDPLGFPQRINDSIVGAFCIHVEADTIARMAGSWRYPRAALASEASCLRLAA